MEWTERTRYVASWGAHYVQINMGGQVTELKFDKDPSFEEIDAVAQKVWENMQPPEAPVPTIQLEAENGYVV